MNHQPSGNDQHPVAPTGAPYGNSYGSMHGYGNVHPYGNVPRPPNYSPIGELAASYGVSNFVRRWAATVIDLLLLGGLFFSFFFVPESLELLLLFFLLLVVVGYYLLFEGFTGFTVGKLALRIQVVDEQGRAPGFVKSLIRTSSRLLEINPILLGGLPAGIAVLASRRNQRLGDMGANTFVVLSKDLVRNGKGKMAFVISAAVTLGIVSFSSLVIGLAYAANMDVAGDTVFVSKDGQFQVTAGSSWSEKKDLVEDADITLGNLLGAKYFVLFTESKLDYYEGTTLEDYSYYVEDNYAYELDNAPLYWPRSLEVNGYPAYQFAYEVMEDDTPLTFVVTTVETKGHFHQLIVWTLSERYERLKEELFELIESFTEMNRSYIL